MYGYTLRLRKYKSSVSEKLRNIARKVPSEVCKNFKFLPTASKLVSYPSLYINCNRNKLTKNDLILNSTPENRLQHSRIE